MHHFRMKVDKSLGPVPQASGVDVTVPSQHVVSEKKERLQQLYRTRQEEEQEGNHDADEGWISDLEEQCEEGEEEGQSGVTRGAKRNGQRNGTITWRRRSWKQEVGK